MDEYDDNHDLIIEAIQQAMEVTRGENLDEDEAEELLQGLRDAGLVITLSEE